MFKKSLFEQKLATSWLGRSFFFFEELDSTNSYAKSIQTSEMGHGLVIMAENQTGGRGQYDRVWQSEPGSNLTFSIIFHPHDHKRFIVLSLAIALALLEMVEEMTGKKGGIKWANDILIEGKKISGLLTETSFSGEQLNRLIVGIGLNINQSDFDESIRDIATSFKQLTKKEWDKEIILADLLGRIEHYYRLWAENNTLLIKKINVRLVGFGEWVQIDVDGETFPEPVKLLGINEHGQMLVLNEELEVITFSHEQISISQP